MKDFLSKIKTLDYKQFALNHGEKIGIGIVGLVVAVVCLFLTSWASEYTGHPRDLETKADEVAAKLRQNAWSDERRKEFPFLVAENELKKVENPLDLADFEWNVPISPKLYQMQQPAEECEWYPVADLVVRFGQIPMGVEVAHAPSDAAVDEDGKPKPAKSEKAGAKKKGEELALPAGFNDDAAGFAGSTEKASGRRFNVVLGVVEVRRQQTALMRALRAGSLSEVKDLLNYKGFRLERQRAVPGPDPWSGDWKEVKIDSSVEVLKEASDYDQDLIAPRYANVEFTSPLPRRLDEDWHPDLVVHYRIPTLNDDEREYEKEQNKAAAAALKESGESDDIEGGGGGFSRIQKDASALRQRARSTPEGADRMNSYMEKMRTMTPGAGGKAAPGGRSGRGGPAAGHAGALGAPGAASAKMMADMAKRAAPMGSAMGPAAGHGPGRMGQMPMAMTGGMAGMGGVSGMGGVADMGADIQLFRYFDFDVEPGECYRYRVQLVVENPSFEQTFVSQPTVAEGELRHTPWSAPSPPGVVERDVEYGLVKVPNNNKGRIEGAELSVVQFDQNLGSHIMDKIKVFYGSYVGTGTKKQRTLHLDFSVPSFKEEDVAFSSKDMLLDSAGGPQLSSPSVQSDLNLTDPNKLKKLLRDGRLDMAVTFDRFGEIIELDAGSLNDLKAARDRVEEERKPYKDIMETDRDKKKKDAKEAGSGLDISTYSPDTGKGKGKKEKAGNPLKAGSVAGSTMPGMGMPPSIGTPGRRGGTRGR